MGRRKVEEFIERIRILLPDRGVLEKQIKEIECVSYIIDSYNIQLFKYSDKQSMIENIVLNSIFIS